jgi:hypothetical protein
LSFYLVVDLNTTATNGFAPHDSTAAQEATGINDGTLRERAREAIRSGKLPAAKPLRMWGGPGIGAACSVCGETVHRGQMELEIEYAQNGATPGAHSYHLHVRCYGAWECERLNLAAPEAINCDEGSPPSSPPRLSPAPWAVD